MAEVESNFPGIKIENSYGDPFVTGVQQDLNLIAAKPTGGNLLSLISKRFQGVGTKTSADKKVVIHLGICDLTAQNSVGGGIEERGADIAGKNFTMPGTGKGSRVDYNPQGEAEYTTAVGIRTPTYVALAHELIHALHVISGDVKKLYDWNNGTALSSSGAIIEEARTVGLGRFLHTSISENAIRRENQLPVRTYYSAAGDCDNVLV
jgi:hypothetical protein